MALGMQVGLGPCHIVLDGDPAPLSKKGAEPPIFDPMWPSGWMHPDATWYGGRTHPWRLCVADRSKIFLIKYDSCNNLLFMRSQLSL